MSAVDLSAAIADIRAAIYTCDNEQAWPAQKALAAVEAALRRPMQAPVKPDLAPTGNTAMVEAAREAVAAWWDDEMHNVDRAMVKLSSTISQPASGAPVSAGTVKPLVWYDCMFAGQPAAAADTDFGPWMAVAYSGRDGRWAHTDPAGNDSEEDWATRAECEAAAQADYAARILSAIETPVSAPLKFSGYAPSPFGDFARIEGASGGLILVSVIGNSGIVPKRLMLPHQLYAADVVDLSKHGEVVVSPVPNAGDHLKIPAPPSTKEGGEA